MHDYHFDKGVLKDTLNLMIIISLLGNKFHLISALIEIIGHMMHYGPSEEHED